MEEQLKQLNWEHNSVLHVAYWKYIGNYRIYVYKFTRTKWIVCLQEDENEITINYNANIEWLLDFVKLLSSAEN